MAVGLFKGYILAYVGIALSSLAETLGPGCHGLATDPRLPNVRQPEVTNGIHRYRDGDKVAQALDEEQQQHLYTSETLRDAKHETTESDHTAKSRFRASAEEKQGERESQWALLFRDICFMLHELARFSAAFIPSKPVVWTLSIIYLIFRLPEGINLFLGNLAILIMERRLYFDFQGRYLGLKQAQQRGFKIGVLEYKIDKLEKEAAESKERLKVLEVKLERIYEQDLRSKAAFTEM
ncbi:hypothetical protein ACHAQA_008843 [Verticillium albo-atrum]